MSRETFSFLVWYWHDGRTDATQLRIVRADTGEEVHLTDGSLLLRISVQPGISRSRCLIRHMQSGREVYLQSGQHLRDFVLNYLVKKNDKAESDDPGTADT